MDILCSFIKMSYWNSVCETELMQKSEYLCQIREKVKVKVKM